jgi:hypothetical protein
MAFNKQHTDQVSVGPVSVHIGARFETSNLYRSHLTPILPLNGMDISKGE